jgi:alanine racemase
MPQMNTFNGAIAQIDLAALHHNFQQVRQHAPNSKIMAMIKSNGYGHGLVPVAKALPTADAFGVACLEEALALRNSKISQPIVIMRGFTTADELPLILEQDLAVVIHDNEQLEILEKTKLVKPLTVWLKIDTGMHRLGFAITEANSAYTRLQKISNINHPITVITHLSDADDLAKTKTLEQLALFNEATKNWQVPKSIANSAGIFGWSTTHSDWIRPGIVLFGVSPFPNKTGIDLNLKPVMTLQSKLVAVKKLKQGDAIGYSSSWICPHDMLVGIASIGYGDGYPRHIATDTPVLVSGIKCTIVGRVSMDMLTIDLTNAPAAKNGEVITLWGKDLPIELIAQQAGTIPYELLCGVTQRVKFEYSL